MTTSGNVTVIPVREAFQKCFRSGQISSGNVLDDVFVQTWNGESISLDENASHFFIVLSGDLFVAYEGKEIHLTKTWYGVLPGALRVSGNGSALIVSSLNYISIPLFGGPLEEHGRLRYVDGCTNSLLLAPPVLGEPCLNFLNLPAGTYQTPHTHPTIRVGMIVSGNGGCGTVEERLVFEPGSVFIIPPDTLHSFQTDDENIRIILFHPDSVVGPTHDNQTMLNNTFVEGICAKGLTNLHTRDLQPV
ncbi:AraC-like ligand binding domain protein [Rubidibacter lacunae KORDI 51-2]|uniref:AraC-like ligand binding domain protein n=1 Tax=Rubidibacter lacunae KORDI 51-2 TaxID=582515 RepID=U5DK58_9CHRO|nr:cupin domain-containing protein [Rubidibacter lacunae]ERN42066.1 AraC-like ligand binding domain protein [Rubidibacter lacunae KORDI 51-2]